MSETARRRPGKRDDLDVPLAVTVTAERMFGESGVEAVSLRAVAREAGVAPAGVTYHFPTKDALVAAVLARRNHVLGQEIRRRLTELDDHPDRASARSLVDAILLPLVDLVASDPAGGMHWLKVFAHSTLTHHNDFYTNLAASPNINVLFARVAERVLGEQTAAIRRRIGIAVFGLINALANADRQGYAAAADERGLDPVFVEELAAFTAAGLRPPP